MTAELRFGEWETALADVDEVDAVIADPPYSDRVHAGHDNGAGMANRAGQRHGYHAARSNAVFRPRRALIYSNWTPDDVDAFVDAWAPRNRGWFVCMSDSELCGAYRTAYERHGLTGFQPLPVLIPGMTVRMAGDGPSSWAFYVNVARPKRLCKWGTLPGGYYGTRTVADRSAGAVAGAKPLWVMRALVRDYTRPGDLIVDPCMGGGTTGLAALIEGRRFVGAEVDPGTFRKAEERLARGYTPALDFGEAV